MGNQLETWAVAGQWEGTVLPIHTEELPVEHFEELPVKVLLPVVDIEELPGEHIEEPVVGVRIEGLLEVLHTEVLLVGELHIGALLVVEPHTGRLLVGELHIEVLLVVLHKQELVVGCIAEVAPWVLGWGCT